MAGDRLAVAVRSPVGVTPDEAQMLRKRQEWRGRILQLCLGFLEGEAASAEVADAASAVGGRAQRRFLEMVDDIKRDMDRLLQSELGVPELEAHRHGANYFLDHLIVFVRQRSEERSRAQGHSPSPPLDGLSREELEQEVVFALQGSAEAAQVFLTDLVRLEEFELEVRHQRRRLQFFLGCDRGLRDLAESNAEIIEAPPEEMAEIVEEFFRICRLLVDDLPPLLAAGSPFPRLAAELEAARDQLDKVVSESIAPLQEVRAKVDRFDGEIGPVLEGLRDLGAQIEKVLRIPPPESWERLGEGGAREGQAPRLHAEVKVLQWHFRNLVETALPPVLDRLAKGGSQNLSRTGSAAADELDALGLEIHQLGTEVLSPAVTVLEGLRPTDQQADLSEDALALLEKLRSRLRELVAGPLRSGGEAVEELAAANVLLLKQRICQELGSIRATFLQPCFAHIAANDPRSSQTPQYFYFKEFADEASRSQELLHFIHGLWRMVEDLQEAHIEGLRFTPKNLNRIAQRVLLDRKTVPGGPGWRELASFLEALKGRLVPRLQLACSLPGIRFDDRNQLSSFADQLTRSCGELLAQRETASRLVRELEALAQEVDVDSEMHRRYHEAVLRVTCEEMAQKLRQVSQALMELVPYVGAMIGGIRMRTSLAFAAARGIVPP